MNFLIIDCLRKDKHPSHFNFDDAIRFIERKKDLSEIHNIDEVYSTQDKDFDKLIKNLSSRDYIDPQKINYVRTGIFLGD